MGEKKSSSCIKSNFSKGKVNYFVSLGIFILTAQTSCSLGILLSLEKKIGIALLPLPLVGFSSLPPEEMLRLLSFWKTFEFMTWTSADLTLKTASVHPNAVNLYHVKGKICNSE